MSVQYDLTIDQGETFSQLITWQTGSPLAPVNITGMTARMQIRDSANLVLFTLTETSGLTLGGIAGTVLIALTQEQTTALLVPVARYDLFLYGAADYKKKLLKGTVTINPSETQ